MNIEQRQNLILEWEKADAEYKNLLKEYTKLPEEEKEINDPPVKPGDKPEPLTVKEPPKWIKDRIQ